MVSSYLMLDGAYRSDTSGHPDEGERLLRTGLHDGAIINASFAGSPDGGMALARRMRSERDDRMVVMISERPDAGLPSRCYDAGADYFLRMPFPMEELSSLLNRAFASRLFATTKRTAGVLLPTEPFWFAGATIRPDMMASFVGGATVRLSPKEVGILRILHRHQGALVKRVDLLSEVWGSAASIVGKSLDTHLVRLRRLFRENGADLAGVISPEPKVGWRVKSPPPPSTTK